MQSDSEATMGNPRPSFEVGSGSAAKGPTTIPLEAMDVNKENSNTKGDNPQNTWNSNNLRQSWNRKPVTPAFYTGEGEDDDFFDKAELSEDEVDDSVPAYTIPDEDIRVMATPYHRALVMKFDHHRPPDDGNEDMLSSDEESVEEVDISKIDAYSGGMGYSDGVHAEFHGDLATNTALTTTNNFVVTDYGATPDGTKDNSKEFLSAWKKACQTKGGTISIPQGTYFVSGADFEGPCKGQTHFYTNATLKASSDPSSLQLDYWILFNNVDSLTISGNGTFDGNGASAWGRTKCSGSSCKQLPSVSVLIHEYMS
ncbi:hypothetical protein BUALT_Bualt03G0229900 [Buddleja alternifolia]|uniref:Pectate lyase superfamily protein domain-containing protein n=1 Tax=Buddleja alternifolia TaxID=168488 RepID=A0AAV6XXR0_9LAMI|nr:hypothetical protein BUALT_Bualt03G0229900 [Buddleja alternifolia]